MDWRSRFSTAAVLALLILFAGAFWAGAESKLTIGVSMHNLFEERWVREQALLEEKAHELGASVIFADAGDDELLQNSQIGDLIAQGADVLIVVAIDGEAAAGAVESAARHGIPAIAYDAPIPHPAALYVAFDSAAAGREMAKAVVKQAPAGNYFWLGGPPADGRAFSIRRGHFEVLQPLIDSGAITLVGEEWTDGLSSAEARRRVGDALTAHDNQIDAVLASSDRTAGGAVQALAERGLAGKVAVSGQGADLAAVQRIATGAQTVTILRDARHLAAAAMEAAAALARGERPSGVNGRHVNEAKGIVQDAVFVEVVAVTSDNLHEAIVEGGLHRFEDVYRGLPRDQWPGRGFLPY